MGPFIGHHSVIIAWALSFCRSMQESRSFWDLGWSPSIEFSNTPYLLGGLGGGGVWPRLGPLQSRSYSLSLSSLA